MRANLRRHAQHLASFVAVERPSKAKIRPASPVALSAWELDCHALVTGTFQVNRHYWLSVSAREVPVLTSRSGTRRARDAWRTSATTTDP